MKKQAKAIGKNVPGNKEPKVKEPLLPNQKKMMQVIAILMGVVIVLGFTLSIMSWFNVF